MLELIGEDELVASYEHCCDYSSCNGCRLDGRNLLRAELRNAINTEGEENEV